MNSALGGFGEEQQMRGVQSQLDLTNCGILGKSFPSQDPQTYPGRRLWSLTTMGLSCFQFSESQPLRPLLRVELAPDK